MFILQILKTLDLLSEGLIKAGDVVVALHYRLDDMSLCIALSHGDIISWNTGGPVMQVNHYCYLPLLTGNKYVMKFEFSCRFCNKQQKNEMLVLK